MRSLAPAIAFALLATPALAAAPKADKAPDPYEGRPEARINFVNNGGILGYTTRRENDEDVLYIEAAGRTWYRARFFGFCDDARFANAIGFRADATGGLDRFSSVFVRHDRCALRSVIRLTPDEAVSLKLRPPPRTAQAAS
jgi:hypothetical protein